MLLTTQYLDEADALADEITVIDHGRVIAHDTPEGLKRVVGGQTLEVRPADPADLDRGRRDPVRGVLRRAKADEIRKGVLAVPVAGDAALTEAVARLGRGRDRGDRALPAPAEPGRGVLHPDRPYRLRR